MREVRELEEALKAFEQSQKERWEVKFPEREILAAISLLERMEVSDNLVIEACLSLGYNDEILTEAKRIRELGNKWTNLRMFG